nr:MAG TPA: hypothetical protein [Caudoviricetes sp.]
MSTSVYILFPPYLLFYLHYNKNAQVYKIPRRFRNK